MELRQLEYFREICRQGSVTAAATALNVSQPSVTAGIKRLEEELGVLLFDRANRRLAVSHVGDEFRKDAEAILAMVEDARLKIQDYRSKPRGLVRIGITPMMSVTLLPPVVARYQEMYPEIEMHVMEEGSLSIAERLKRGELDLGILITQSLPSGLASAPIRRGEILACLSPGHRLADSVEIPLAELKDEPFILFHEDTYSRQLILRECRRLGFEPHVVFASSQIGTVAGLVREGMGIAFFFEDIANTLDSIEFRPLVPRLELEAGVVWNERRYLSMPTRHLIRAFVGNEQDIGSDKNVDKRPSSDIL